MLRACLVAILALCPAIVLAQSPFFTEDFDGVAAGTFPPGWSASAATGTPLTGWSVDNTPAIPGISSGTHPYNGGCYSPVILPVPPDTQDSAPNSLNFNNGADQENGGLYSGDASSPVIPVTSFAGVTLTYFCQWEGLTCDTGGAPLGIELGSDQKFVEVLDGSSGAVLISVQMAVDADGDGAAPFTTSSPLIDIPCTEMFQPHFHTIDLSSLTASSIRIRFRVNQTAEPTLTDPFSGLPIDDTYWTGWFIDTVQLNCPTPDTSDPSIPTPVLPADTACVTSPVVFDWTDSTDTGPCGPGSVTYGFQIDDDPTFATPTTFLGLSSSDITIPSAPGVFYWRVSAGDASGNFSGPSAAFEVTIESPALPLAPDTLFVNEPIPGAQVGDAGFVDPVASEQPVFSAIFRDPNCNDSALQYRMQIATDGAFAGIVFDSLAQPISGLAKDERSGDISIGTSLQKDTIHFWRIQFADGTGFGPFSVAQSFRIGDAFEFGVRDGSSNHSRRCWVATAAYGSPSATPVASLQAWRAGTLEQAASGRALSRGYHTVGQAVAKGFDGSASVRAAVAPMAALTGTAGMMAAAAVLLALVLLGAMRSR